ncbi:MAG TPA: class I SAM-dependent methyltransferase [Bacillales bacterium]|nr:class I SAM-dependent methyltransferase [Bacillales bacterium]
MGSDASYDSSLFEGTAKYYQYRPAYPQALLEWISEVYHLDGTGWALDLGCGIGNLTRPLAHYFEEVVGMDPDREMLEEARRLSNLANLEFRQGSSWDLSSDMGPYRLVAMGESFHWMDRDDVLRKLYEMVQPQGGVVVASKKIDGSEEYHEVVNEVIREFLGAKRRAGKGYYEHPKESHQTVLARSPFKVLEAWRHEYSMEWSIDEIIGFLYSTSYANKRLLDDQADEFEKVLRERLSGIEAHGELNFRIETEAWFGRKDNG